MGMILSLDHQASLIRSSFLVKVGLFVSKMALGEEPWKVMRFF